MKRSIQMPVDFSAAKALSLQIEGEYNKASKALQALSGGGPMGLTPDSVKATTEWQEAKRAYDTTFAAYRAFNAAYVKQFKRDLVKERAARFAKL